MTTEPDLLPLPEGDAAWYYIGSTHVYSAGEMESYARANVSHATAAKDAEVEALRAEVEFLRRGIVPRDDDMIVPIKLLDEINASGAEWKDRAERLAEEVEALRAEVERVTCELMDAITRADKLAEALRELRNHTSVNSDQIALIDAALEQENDDA